MSLDVQVRRSKSKILLGLTDALTTYHSVFLFPQVSRGRRRLLLNVLVIPCVQFHVSVPGISFLTTKMFPFLSFQAAATYITWSQILEFVLSPVVSSKIFLESVLQKFYSRLIILAAKHR